MLTKQDKSKLRSTIFRHLDGIATTATCHLLYDKGILRRILKEKTVKLSEITKDLNANEGYLNVALHTMCSQSWLVQNITSDDVEYSITEKGEIAFRIAHIYRDATAFIPHAVKISQFLEQGFDQTSFALLQNLIANYKKRFDLDEPSSEIEKEVQNQMLLHIEGIIAGPMIVGLGMTGMFHKYFSIAPFEVEEFRGQSPEIKVIIEFFRHLGWFNEQDGIYNFTETGLFFAKRASAYGVTVSYLPTFMMLSEITFGSPNIFWERPSNTAEIHVDRKMNVWGSGGAHTAYFKKVDEIIIEIFNQPIDSQPKGFLDMGCGNGAFIDHIFEIIWTKTLRGKHLDDYPLFIVGADYNEAALKATRETLNNADIWAKVVSADISQPKLLAEELKKKYHIDLVDLLNVRSFLDHNRIFSFPNKVSDLPASDSKGAFAFRGQRIPNEVVEENLREHLGAWKPYVEKFGLLVIELHTIAPSLGAANIGKTAVTAYNATHGFSDQYILEISRFLEVAKTVGLSADKRYSTKYPNSDLATVSINLLKEEATH